MSKGVWKLISLSRVRISRSDRHGVVYRQPNAERLGAGRVDHSRGADASLSNSRIGWFKSPKTSNPERHSLCFWNARGRGLHRTVSAHVEGTEDMARRSLHVEPAGPAPDCSPLDLRADLRNQRWSHHDVRGRGRRGRRRPLVARGLDHRRGPPVCRGAFNASRQLSVHPLA